jgi:predicted nuclease with TOPRIM domain
MEATITKRLIEIMDENQTLLETNANLQTQIENIQEEIQILTGDLRATASALDELE